MPECDPSSPFDAPEPLSELATATSRESDVTLDPTTENVAYVLTSRSGEARAVFTTSRANRAALFGALSPVSAVLLPPGTTRVLLTADGLQMILAGDGISVASRASVSDPFGAPSKLDLTHDGAKAAPRCPSIDASGTTLYYSDGGKIFQQALATPSAPSTRIAELDGFSCLVLSGDDGEGLVARDGKVYRTTHGVTWSAPELDAELSRDGALTQATYLTKNHCDAYLTSNRDGADRIYWAHRTPR